ncbi:MAG: hypothetical protein CMI02_06350 [Oceanospirillaceae bacterium]|nr:hypothetical protein [Oceanospirillaceae bacterium]MBT11636.1 hypothetical protein [Oceanospirillaceae bacterium]|tara:strand:+ start:20210 stop:20653 length:444 start_codon:yes stop_codon:yes gene_type:complete
MKGLRGSAWLSNVPLHADQQSLAGCTPQISELIEDTLPLVWHLMSRNGLTGAVPVCFIYINPRTPLADNAAALLSLLDQLDGMEAAVVPVSASHTAILHSVRLALPELTARRLEQIQFLYIGDNANRRAMEAMASESRMRFAYHALY